MRTRAISSAGRRRFVGFVPVGVVAILLLILLPFEATASNWGSSATNGPGNLCTSWNDPNFQNSQCTPANQYQFVYISAAVPSALRTALTNSVNNDYNR